MSGRGIAIAILVSVSCTSFALGFFVGKASTEPGAQTPAVRLQTEQGTNSLETPEASSVVSDASDAVVRQYPESLKPSIDAPYPPPGREDTAPDAIVRDNPSSHDSEAESAGEDTSYSVQVGAYSDNTEAEKIKDNLSGKGYNSYIVKSTDRGRKTIYRVRVGDFDDKADAKRMVLKLKRLEGKSAFIAEGR